MELLQLILAVVAALSPACDAGLLRVPRVYNALISTNQRLAPSRADTVSLPAVPVLGPLAVLPAAHAALVPAALVEDEGGDKANATAPSAPANGTAAAAAVLPVAVYSPYSPYYYSSYSYHYSNPFLLPPPLFHPYSYGYGYLPLAFAHPVAAVPAAPSGDGKKAEDAPKESDKDDGDKEAVTIKDI